MNSLSSWIGLDNLTVFALNLLIQFTLLSVLALLAVRLFRHHAALRHWILLSVLICLSASPVLTALMQSAGMSVAAIDVSWVLPKRPSSRPDSGAVKFKLPKDVHWSPETGDDVEDGDDTDLRADAVASRNDFAKDRPDSPAENEEEKTFAPRSSDFYRDSLQVGLLFVLSVWFVGSVAALLGIVRSVVKLRHIARRSHPLEFGDKQRAIDSVREIMGVAKLPPIAASSQVDGPSVVGVIRPTIVLPARLVALLGPSELRDVLLHETAHVLRRDHWIVLLQRVLGAMFWPHPLLHVLNRCLARAREEVCDNFVLSAVEPVAYGETLLRLGQLLPAGRHLAGSVGLFNSRWKLEDRIEGILNNRRKTMTRIHTAKKFWVLALFAILSLSIATSKFVWSQKAQADKADRPTAKEGSAGNTKAEAPASDKEPIESTGTTQAVAKEAPKKLAAAKKERRGDKFYIMNADGSGRKELFSSPEYHALGSPDFSADGKQIAFDGWKAQAGEGFNDTRVFVVDANGKNFRDLGPGAMPSWSPQGNRIVYSRTDDRGVWMMRSDGSEKKKLDENGWSGQWSPNGLMIAYSSGKNLTVYNLAEDKKILLFPEGESPYSYTYWNLTWSPDNNWLCFKGRTTDGLYQVAVVSVKGSSKGFIEIMKGKQQPYADFAWHPDGKQIVIAKWSKEHKFRQMFLVNPLMPGPHVLVPGQAGDINNGGMCWSPDGKKLLYVAGDY